MSANFPLYDIVQNNKAKHHWKLQLLNDRLVLYSSDGTCDFQVMRTDAPTVVSLIEWSSANVLLSIKAGKTRTFKLTPEVAAATRDWIGPMTTEHLKVALKRNLWTAVSVGVFLLSMSFRKSRGHGLDFEPGFFLLGLVLFGSVFLSVVRPHRASLLVYSSCFLLVATIWTYQVAFGQRNWLMAVGAAANFIIGLGTLFEFRRFRSIQSSRS